MRHSVLLKHQWLNATADIKSNIAMHTSGHCSDHVLPTDGGNNESERWKDGLLKPPVRNTRGQGHAIQSLFTPPLLLSS